MTEFNASGGSTKGEQAQADELHRMMTYLKGYGDKYRVEAAFIYELLDEPSWEPSSEARMGLYTLKPQTDGEWAIGRPKKAAEAVASFLSPDGERASTRPATPTRRAPAPSVAQSTTSSPPGATRRTRWSTPIA